MPPKKPKQGYKLVKGLFGKEIEIPEEWEYPKFNDVVKTNPSTNIVESIIPYIPMDAVDTETPNFNYYEERKFSENTNLSQFQNNDILFARITPSTENGKTCIVENFERNGIVSSELTVLRVTERILPRYLYYYVKSYRIRQLAISQMAGSTGRQRVPDYVFKKDLSVELPTLPEQRKIASILSGVDALIEKTQEAIEKTERLKKGLMQRLLTRGIGHTKFKKVRWMFGREIEIPEEWEIRQYDELFEFLRTGTNPRSDLRREGEIQYIHYGDIHAKWNSVLDCNIEEIPFIDKSKVENLPLLRDGDLIIADASEDHEGSGASVLLKNIQNRKTVSGLHTIALRKMDESVSPGFLRYLNSMQFVKIQIISRVTGISVFGLSKNNLKRIKIPLPTLPEQRQIASILSGVDAPDRACLTIATVLRMRLAIILILFAAVLNHEFHNTEKDIHNRHNSG